MMSMVWLWLVMVMGLIVFDRRVRGFPLVFHLSNISVLVVSSVGDNLGPTVRKRHSILALEEKYTVHTDTSIRLRFELTQKKMAEAVTFVLTQGPGQFWQYTHSFVS